MYGVGITYSAAIEPLLDRSPDLFDVLEIEPQTLWTRVPHASRPFSIDGAVLDHLEQLPGRKLIHSVGTPVGGTVWAWRATPAMRPGDLVGMIALAPDGAS